MPESQLTAMPLHPERELAVAHARRTVRASLSTLFALDERLGTIVARTREPGIGMIRLMWWRDALVALDAAPPPAEPLLAAAAALRPDRIAGSELAAMADGWEVLFDDPDLGIETAMTHARQRGTQLFTLVGQVLGSDVQPSRLASAGEGWALADLARHYAPLARRQPLLAAARRPLESAMATPWPVSLRPLGMLAALALQDARRGADALRPPASSARLLRMLVHRWTGR
jgi:phytoene synthase